MSAGRIEAVFRYPVKSMQGERLAQAALSEHGIPGDRAWAVRDEERGGIRGAKRFPELMQCAARYEADPPLDGSGPARVTLPDGRQMNVDDPALPALLGRLVGSPVTVWPLIDPARLDHYRRGAPVLEDQEAELRRVFGRTADEPLPALGDFPKELFEFESPPGTYFDAFPLLVMTTASLQRLGELDPGRRFDVRRFRPNLLVETPGPDGFPERAWVGRMLRIGTAEIEITMECPRCVMTTHAFDDVPKDPRIMRTLVREANGNLGVYAKVSKPGTLGVGDAVQVL